MTQEEIIERIAPMVAQRGYLVIATNREYATNEQIEWIHYGDEDAELRHPWRVSAQTDLADFNEQRGMLGYPPEPEGSSSFFYRLVTD